MSFDLYQRSSYDISQVITQNYSTSFSLATSLLEKEQKKSIYAIYGFVRLADEIVDTMYDYNQAALLQKLNQDLQDAINQGISTNPILFAFTETVKKYDIDQKHIRAFMKSMHDDLSKTNYNSTNELNSYIYGSADVVGLMCLKVFCNGNIQLYNKLEYSAQKLGSAFQKVNFLRDLKDDLNELGRSYFPELVGQNLNQHNKTQIENSIEQDFTEAWKGLKQLPGRSKLAVAIAFYYYKCLLKKIKNSSPEKVLQQRMRISDSRKYSIIAKASLMYLLKAI